jgi:hypothetical protein
LTTYTTFKWGNTVSTTGKDGKKSKQPRRSYKAMWAAITEDREMIADEMDEQLREEAELASESPEDDYRICPICDMPPDECDCDEIDNC